MTYLLDANALIRYLMHSALMPTQVRETISPLREGDRLAISIIALIEIWDVARKRRGDFIPFDEVMQALADMNIEVIPLTPSIIHLLPDEWNDMHDMIILATALDLQARHGEVAIISSDRQMRFNQTLIPCVW